MKIPLSLLFLLFGFFSFAQSLKSKPITITGKVVDKQTSTPLEYATIVVQNNNSSAEITGGITNSKGSFMIETKKGIYNIRVEYVSYKNYEIKNQKIDVDFDMGTIAIEIAASNLKEVEITREKTSIEVKLDKKIYNIGKDLTTAGGTVSDALDNVPSVTVDVDGTVSLRGNENVRILINGKPSAMVSSSDSDFLNQLPADAVDKVEVISSPSARYDAEGTAGILNIVLKKQKTLGANGTISLNTGFPSRTNISTNLNYRTSKVNLFSTLVYFYKTPPGTLFFINDYESGNFSQITEDRQIAREDYGFTANFGADYYLSETTTLSANVYGKLSDELDFTENNSLRYDFSDELSEQLFIEEEVEEDDGTLQTSLNFNHNFNLDGQKLTIDFQYSFDDEDIFTRAEDNIVFPINELDELENVLEKETKNEFLVQADYVLPVGDSQFEVGYRGTFEEEINDYELQDFNIETNQFEVVEALTNEFTYNENTNAFYAQFGNKFGKFSFLAGLRMEYTKLKGTTVSDFDINVIEEILGQEIELNFEKDYLEPFPTLNLIYELGEDENITIGYNRRINRPRGFFINPFPSRSSDTNIFQGNPGILPAFSGAYEIGYLKRWDKITLNASVYYQRTENAFEVIEVEAQNTVDEEDTAVIMATPINLTTNERYGAEIGFLYNPLKWMRFNWSLNAFNFTNEGEFDGQDFGAEDFTWFTRFSSKITLPGKIDWQTNFNYRGARETAQTVFEPSYRLDLAFSKELNKKLTATFNVRDLLNTRRRIFTATTNTFTTFGDLQFRQRQFNFTLLYRFGKRFEDKKGKKKGGKKNRPTAKPSSNESNEDGGF